MHDDHPALSVTVSRRAAATTVELQGGLELASVAWLERILRAAVLGDGPTGAPDRDVVLDLAAVGSIAEGCIPAIVDVCTVLRSAGRQVSFRSLAPAVRCQFEAAGAEIGDVGDDAIVDELAATLEGSAAVELLAIALDELSATAARVLEVDAASTTVLRRGRPATLAASAPWSRDLDHVQYAAGDGPCLAAARSGEATRIVAITADARWPAFAEAAARAGVVAVLSTPITTAGAVLGALNLYSRTPRLPDPDDAADLARRAATAVALAPLGTDSIRDGAWAALESRRKIGTAQGVLMARERLGAKAAYAALADRARAHGTRTEDEAEDVLRSLDENDRSRPQRPA